VRRHACGVNPQVKVPGIVTGMAVGADSIEDLGLPRHGAMPGLFGGIRAPSTLGPFLRSFTWGNVLQFGRMSRLMLAELARRAPLGTTSRARGSGRLDTHPIPPRCRLPGRIR
jgi:hypothetical protein